MPPGYSDRINHALAFAAKHHDRQVRKGTRLPYLTNAANVAVILARYDQDESTVVAGILHDVVEDCVGENYTGEMLEQRIGAKFGAEVLDTVLGVTLRRRDDDGMEFATDERRDDLLERLGQAKPSGLWVCAADALHNAHSILTDLRRTVEPDTVWNRFAAGHDGTVRWYRAVHDRLRAVGFDAPIVDELRDAVESLERWTDPGDALRSAVFGADEG
jgi:(p)ppGpp synthase/HD superfamily hydrolase